MNAKEIFTMYHGSKFQMEREGNLREYQSFGITKETEIAWAKEAFSEACNSVTVDENAFSRARLFVGFLKDASLIDVLISIQQKLLADDNRNIFFSVGPMVSLVTDFYRLKYIDKCKTEKYIIYLNDLIKDLELKDMLDKCFSGVLLNSKANLDSLEAEL